MRIYTGRFRERMGIVHPRWYRRKMDGVFERRLTKDCQVEIVRLWGISIGGVFIGVQRFVGVQDDMARMSPEAA